MKTLEGCDYIVKQKTFMESILNIEFIAPTMDKGFFYTGYN